MFNFSFSSVELGERPTRDERFGAQAIIIDLGTHSIKFKRLLESSGMQKVRPYVVLGDNQVGKMALIEKERNKSANLATPFNSAGTIVKYHDILGFLARRIFKEEIDLDVEDGRVSIIVAEPVVPIEDLNSKARHRLNTAHHLVDLFKAEAFYVSPQPLLAIGKYNLTSGVVIDVGHTYTRVSVVFNGGTLPQCTHISPVAGKLFDEMLLKELACKGFDLDLCSNDLMSSLKEKTFFVSNEIDSHRELLEKEDEELINSLNVQVRISGIPYTLGRERFLIPEVLFDPSHCDSGYSDEDSVQGLVLKAKLSFEALREKAEAGNNFMFTEGEASSVFQRIVITGGSTRMRGMQQRIQTEIRRSLAQHEKNKQGSDPFGETVEEIMERQAINFYYQTNPTKAGFDSFLGADKIAREASNDIWIMEKDFGYNLENMIQHCPS